MSAVTQLPAWQALQKRVEPALETPIQSLFDDPERFDKYSLKVQNILLDISKNPIDDETFQHLLALARQCDLEKCRDDMFNGEHINVTEDRAVLHTALRNRGHSPVYVDGEDVMPVIEHELKRIRVFVNAVRKGRWRGHSGKRITDVVNIGIGGSDLGPRMVTQALKPYADDQIKIHFVSNVDGMEIANVLKGLNPERVLFVVASKTFTTAETMTNAQTARNWLMASSFDSRAVAQHFVAVSSNAEAVKAFGIKLENTFQMWDWVGGRFSLWSAIGLPIALYLGFRQFEELLQGAHDMDLHFRNEPLERNAPMWLALTALWNSTFMGRHSQAILPYDWPLQKFSAYLQQAEMESNGKSVDRNGDIVPYTTGSIIWGQLGIDGQHAFYQYLHQGSTVVPADFIGSIESSTPVEGHHEKLMANFFAQTEALMCGINADDIRRDLTAKGMSSADIERLIPHKIHQGNRPTNSLLLDQLNPRTLGALIALYEHKIFILGTIWDICSFDQWGVELGKTLAKNILPELQSGDVRNDHDDSTRNLMQYFVEQRKNSGNLE
ncbi:MULTISPECIES: glucose-6-phosphate isomerase [unclassified Oceanobacter]|uniref:glucose-6-phosphate isomerase n=1 Tax=unclassified Oceanobacter TaxID=2620260 RepID=UPI0026E19742|nr:MULTISPECIES: glucose-6-phosphate isomerase [unclassified Oceanobacter]MDO6682041.1 glucose-6-phosphate isomerase [Oceanobacter sp. 5_MG-2023]MDP2505564.1 glucose-6-phosphate isomerase [Oceanobacter sp. 3_MG-2023]MDP2547146.1 glucose-6-phosphate isomerase [Oceanobacter sp. 4_MG-2023]MDP2609763.1 glucose-6-phosphate isomerase [Oceanobacter sp. 1_MG-2023]MDP2613094.1 glucose-6-phosphate isomerase [Oceanobacter sp. 2_MG-2023]